MKRLIATIFLLHYVSFSFGQNHDIKSMVDSLQYMDTDTLDCSADLYWRIIAEGDKAIPFLISKITDTTQTRMKFHCKKTRLNIAEIAQFALTEIAYFPAFLVTKIQFDYFRMDETGQTCWSFYDFFFVNSNKPRYQRDLINWYNKQRLKYKEIKIETEKQGDCQRQYGINTYYRWIE